MCVFDWFDYVFGIGITSSTCNGISVLLIMLPIS
jgi:hypothetical protein